MLHETKKQPHLAVTFIIIWVDSHDQVLPSLGSSKYKGHPKRLGYRVGGYIGQRHKTKDGQKVETAPQHQNKRQLQNNITNARRTKITEYRQEGTEYSKGRIINFLKTNKHSLEEG